MASTVWDTVMTTFKMYKGQRVHDAPSWVFSNEHFAYSVLIQSTLSWHQKMEDSTSLKEIQGDRRTEAELKVMTNTPKVLPSASYLEVVVTEVLAPSYLSVVPLPCTAPLLSLHTHCGLKSSWGLPPDQTNAQWVSEEAKKKSLKLQKKKPQTT